MAGLILYDDFFDKKAIEFYYMMMMKVMIKYFCVWTYGKVLISCADKHKVFKACFDYFRHLPLSEVEYIYIYIYEQTKTRGKKT